MNSDICGFCTEHFGIKGFAYTVGGASASGQVSIIQAVEAVESGQVDVCIAVGALMDLSYLECHAFRSIGAMGSDRYSEEPSKACRPFDRHRDGFIYCESCGVVVIEKEEHFSPRMRTKPYASLSGWSIKMDANRNPNPSYEGEASVMKHAIQHANLSAKDIDYINPHGTASTIGDETEMRAILDNSLSHAYINATKSITGHVLTAAGAVEIIATILQMQESKLHPTRNLDHPIEPALNCVRENVINYPIQHTLSMSMGFGGMNTAVCLSRMS